MICEIKHDGIMFISSETELESYALKKWIDENMICSDDGYIKLKHICLLFKYKGEEENE